MELDEIKLMKQIEDKERELKKLKENNKALIEKKEKEEKARNFFLDNFKLYISDDYNVYPEEYNNHCLSRFVVSMLGKDEKEMKAEIPKYKKMFLEFLDDDIEMLQEQRKHIVKQIGEKND